MPKPISKPQSTTTTASKSKPNSTRGPAPPPPPPHQSSPRPLPPPSIDSGTLLQQPQPIRRASKHRLPAHDADTSSGGVKLLSGAGADVGIGAGAGVNPASSCAGFHQSIELDHSSTSNPIQSLQPSSLPLSSSAQCLGAELPASFLYAQHATFGYQSWDTQHHPPLGHNSSLDLQQAIVDNEHQSAIASVSDFPFWHEDDTIPASTEISPTSASTASSQPVRPHIPRAIPHTTWHSLLFDPSQSHATSQSSSTSSSQTAIREDNQAQVPVIKSNWAPPLNTSSQPAAASHPSSPAVGVHTGLTPAINDMISNDEATFIQAFGGGDIMGSLGATPGKARHDSYADASRSSGDNRIPLLSSLASDSGPRSMTDIPKILPHEKVFPIQIGSELFRLSGASLSSDGQYFDPLSASTASLQEATQRSIMGIETESLRAPSYFSQFFERQLQSNDGIRTLYIDRDPVTFQDISRHLQGYHIAPRDGTHYVKLFADAQFYSLPRLISQLFDSEIFIEIGHRHFQIPRDIFSSPGDSPNFFSLGFGVFFATPTEVFPGLNREGLLRPPSLLPPSVPNRSADVFGELIHMLRGYPLHIRNPTHRAELLRDCRYFQFRGLEQKLIPYNISYNLKRSRSEIAIRLEDIKASGLSFQSESTPADPSPLGGWVKYSRPFVDEESFELILEISGECSKIDLRTMRADFHGEAKARISGLFQVVANKMNLPTTQPLGLLMLSGAKQGVSPGNSPLSEDQVRIRFDRDSVIVLDGQQQSSDRINGAASDEYDGDDAVHGSVLHGAVPNLSAHGSDGNFATTATQSSGLMAGRTMAESSPGWPNANLYPSTGGTSTSKANSRKRKRRSSLDDLGEWVVRRAQWRLRVQPCADTSKGGMEVVLVAVKLEAFSNEQGRNAHRQFLSG